MTTSTGNEAAKERDKRNDMRDASGTVTKCGRHCGARNGEPIHCDHCHGRQPEPEISRAMADDVSSRILAAGSLAEQHAAKITDFTR